jgi:hypothetical protein
MDEIAGIRRSLALLLLSLSADSNRHSGTQSLSFPASGVRGFYFYFFFSPQTAQYLFSRAG